MVITFATVLCYCMIADINTTMLTVMFNTNLSSGHQEYSKLLSF